MKMYLAILIIVLFASCAGNIRKQNKKQAILYSLRSTCDTNADCYIERAKEDFKQGHLRAFYNSLIEGNSFDDYYSECLSKQGVETIGAGDIADHLLMQYNREMARLIKDSFGQHYFDNCRLEARERSGQKGSAFDGLW